MVGNDGDLMVIERNPPDNIGAVQDLLMVVSDGVIVLDCTAFLTGPNNLVN